MATGKWLDFTTDGDLVRKWLLLLLLVPTLASAQGISIYGSAVQNVAALGAIPQHLVPVPNAQIYVCPGNVAPAANVICTPSTSSLFSNATLITPVSNPFTADANGNYLFFVAQGTSYIITEFNPTLTTARSYVIVNAGGSGITSSGSPVAGNLTVWAGPASVTNGNLSGDVTTTGSTGTTVVGLRNSTLPTIAGSTGFLFDLAGVLSLSTSASNLTTGTLPHAQLPALLVTDVPPGSNGQCLITSGSASTWGSCAGTAGVQLIGTPFVTSSTVNAATTSQQNLAAACASPPCYSAGALNSNNKTFDVEAGGTVSLVNSSQSMAMGLNIGSNNQVVGTTSVNLPTNFGNWYAKLDCTVTTSGTSANLRCLLYFTFVGGTSAQSVWTTIIYNPASANGTIDLTTALSPGFWVAFGSASASNSMTQTYAFTHQHN